MGPKVQDRSPGLAAPDQDATIYLCILFCLVSVGIHEEPQSFSTGLHSRCNRGIQADTTCERPDKASSQEIQRSVLRVVCEDDGNGEGIRRKDGHPTQVWKTNIA